MVVHGRFACSLVRALSYQQVVGLHVETKRRYLLSKSLIYQTGSVVTIHLPKTALDVVPFQLDSAWHWSHNEEIVVASHVELVVVEVGCNVFLLGLALIHESVLGRWVDVGSRIHKADPHELV